MFLKRITKSVRSLGMFLIFLMAAGCIFGSIVLRDNISSNFFGQFLAYTISFENRFYDYRIKNQLDMNFRSKEIVLVNIDDYSLQKLGVWPIPRTEHAKMLAQLKLFGAKVVALDILFPEKSPMQGETSPDSLLAYAIRDFQTDGRRVFLGYTLTPHADDALIEAPVEMLNDAIQTRTVPEVDMIPRKISKFTFPIPEFVETEVGLGSIDSEEDRDGIFRQYQLISNVDTIYYGSLGFNAYEAYAGTKTTIKISADATGELVLNGKNLEINNRGETKIRYVGDVRHFPSVSLYDLINAKADDPELHKLLKDKIVFVGSTAAGAHDLRPSPLDSKMPGVFSHINLTHMLIHQYFYQDINESVKWSLVILLVGMFIFVGVQYFDNAFLDAISVMIILAASYFIDQYYFLPRGYELKLFYCYFCFIACYSWNTFLQFYESNKEKKQIKGTFSRYVAPTVVEEMLKDPSKLHVGGTKMDISCLFSDVRDFTSISESMSATDLAQTLNTYMSVMTDIVFDTKGTVDKYIGDAIVGLWGAPLPIGNHAELCVEAAVKMMEAMPALNDEFTKTGRPFFKVGIGINSGECSVGNMGSTRIFSYTALGDNMNLGARLEGLCKHYGANILISSYTLERIDKSKYKTRPIDKVIVKGKTTPVSIFEVLHNEHPMTKDPEAHNFYLMAYQLFQKRNFQAALEIFDQLIIGLGSDKSTFRLRELCQKYHDHPELVTDDFDVTKMTEK